MQNILCNIQQQLSCLAASNANLVSSVSSLGTITGNLQDSLNTLSGQISTLSSAVEQLNASASTFSVPVYNDNIIGVTLYELYNASSPSTSIKQLVLIGVNVSLDTKLVINFPVPFQNYNNVVAQYTVNGTETGTGLNGLILTSNSITIPPIPPTSFINVIEGV